MIIQVGILQSAFPVYQVVHKAVFLAQLQSGDKSRTQRQGCPLRRQNTMTCFGHTLNPCLRLLRGWLVLVIALCLLIGCYGILLLSRLCSVAEAGLDAATSVLVGWETMVPKSPEV